MGITYRLIIMRNLRILAIVKYLKLERITKWGITYSFTKCSKTPFKDVVEKTNLGKKFKNSRNSVTLHSLRWFTQTTVERVTKRDVVGNYWIGKEQKKLSIRTQQRRRIN